MPIMLHGLVCSYIIYRIFRFIYHILHLLTERFLVTDLGLPWPVASIVAFIIVGIAVSFLFRHRHSFL